MLWWCVVRSEGRWNLLRILINIELWYYCVQPSEFTTRELIIISAYFNSYFFPFVNKSRI
jgi:hypothetical protein